MTQIGALWQAASETDKHPYTIRAKELAELYKIAMEKYKSNM